MDPVFMKKIKDKKVLIKVDSITIAAELLDTPTAHALLAALPCTASIRTWGDEIYFPLALGTGPEADAREVVEAGELAYWPEGGCIAIGFGPTPVSRGEEIRLVAPVNIWGLTAGSEVENLATVSAGATASMEAATAG
ncbi:MAG: cyclophilin-like fold protein [Gammaproteobacteria bacterium]|nr:cyclophilin-like fold protein [Gammaproteobacteria bacterium]